MARGFTQSYGIDYQETFAPVAKLNTVQIILSIAVNQDWALYQLDVKNAFLNGYLMGEVYMDVPPGFESNHSRHKVCKLRKSLYGLKQSPRAWLERFTKVLKLDDYSQFQADHTLFVKHLANGRLTILIVYVDDIVVTGNHEEICHLKYLLSKEFEIKDLGHLRYFLGMEVARSNHGVLVSQCKCVLDLLRETGMSGCKLVETLMDPNIKLEACGKGIPVDKGKF